jgi:hypothetical protein
MARDSGTPLYAQQDRETEPIMRLQKGEALTPMAESVVAFFSSVFPLLSRQYPDTLRAT